LLTGARVFTLRKLLFFVPMRSYKYYLIAFLSFVIWGFFSLALKPLHNYPSLDILFYRVFLCAVILLLISLFIRRSVLKQNIAIYKAMPPREQRSILMRTIGGGVLLTAN